MDILCLPFKTDIELHFYWHRWDLKRFANISETFSASLIFSWHHRKSDSNFRYSFLVLYRKKGGGGAVASGFAVSGFYIKNKSPYSLVRFRHNVHEVANVDMLAVREASGRHVAEIQFNSILYLISHRAILIIPFFELSTSLKIVINIICLFSSTLFLILFTTLCMSCGNREGILHSPP